MPYYVFRMYYDDVNEELKAKKKQYDEQQKKQDKNKFRMPKMRMPKFR